MIDKRIINFINSHHLLSLATVKEKNPYCANCFFVYNEKKNWLIFSSDQKTKHAQYFTQNSNVAATISLETKDVNRIQGVQLCGTILKLKGQELEIAKKQYIKAFSYAKLMNLTLWAMQLTFIKMTHNKLGFGRKLIWKQ